MSAKPRIAVISPFLDKRNGTERCVAEQVERLAEHYEIHVYSTRVEDIDLNKIAWHRIPAVPGPHVVKYLWWFAANHLWRWWDRRFYGAVVAPFFSAMSGLGWSSVSPSSVVGFWRSSCAPRPSTW